MGLLRFGVVSDGSYQGTCPHVSVESRSIEKAFGKATSTDKLEVEMLPHMADGRVGVLIDDSAIRAKASCLHLPSMLKDCLTRHTCQWKLDSRNSLSEPA